MNFRETLGFHLVNIVKLKWNLIDTKLKILGLSRTEWRALLWLKILGPCSQKELLEALTIDAAHLTRTLTKLEENDYILRVQAKKDRRSLQVQLSAKAEQTLLPSIEKSIAEEHEILFHGMTDKEKTQLMQLLKKVENNLLANKE